MRKRETAEVFHASNANAYSRATQYSAPNLNAASLSSPSTLCSSTLRPTLPALTVFRAPFHLSASPMPLKHSSCWHRTSLSPSTTNQAQTAGLHVHRHPDWYAIPFYLHYLTCLVHFLLPTKQRSQRQLENVQRRSSNDSIRRHLRVSFNMLIQHVWTSGLL